MLQFNNFLNQLIYFFQKDIILIFHDKTQKKYKIERIVLKRLNILYMKIKKISLSNNLKKKNT